MLIAATDSDLLDRANRIRSCFDSVAFFDEWQEEQFDEEQLESMSLLARQDELKEILADPSVAVMHDSLSCSLIALNGMASCLIDRRVLKANINDAVDSEVVLCLCTRQVTDEQREDSSEFFHIHLRTSEIFS